jgi:hypothetical protein
MSLRLVPLIVALAACKAAEEAPDDLVEGATYTLGEAATYAFSGFDGDEAELVVALLDLEAAMGELDVDVSNPKDRAYTLDKLTESQMGGATMPPEADPAEQIATLVLGRSDHDVAANETIVAEPNQVCIESNTTVYYARTYTTDLDCFVDGTCDLVRSTNEVRKENALAKGWYDLFKDFRRVDLGDGRTALVARSWIAEKFLGDNGNAEFAQTFTAEIWIPDGETSLRAYAMWAEINIGLGDDIMQNVIIDGVDEGMENADGWLAGDDTYCNLDRGRAYDRE